MKPIRRLEDDTIALDPRIVYHISDLSYDVCSGKDIDTAIHYQTDCHATVAVDPKTRQVFLFFWRGRYSSPASSVTFQSVILKEIEAKLIH